MHVQAFCWPGASRPRKPAAKVLAAGRAWDRLCCWQPNQWNNASPAETRLSRRPKDGQPMSRQPNDPLSGGGVSGFS